MKIGIDQKIICIALRDRVYVYMHGTHICHTKYFACLIFVGKGRRQKFLMAKISRSTVFHGSNIKELSSPLLCMSYIPIIVYLLWL